LIHQPTERQKWFLSRVGKRVYRNSFCDCALCNQIIEHGLIITDEEHAGYLAGFEAESHAEGNPVHYFDSREEVDKWLATLPK
jgi:hypothetical protein